METTFYQGLFPSMCCDCFKSNFNPYVWNSFPERLCLTRVILWPQSFMSQFDKFWRSGCSFFPTWKHSVIFHLENLKLGSNESWMIMTLLTWHHFRLLFSVLTYIIMFWALRFGVDEERGEEVGWSLKQRILCNLAWDTWRKVRKPEISCLIPPACIIKFLTRTVFYLEIVRQAWGFPFGLCMEKCFTSKWIMLPRFQILSLVEEMSCSFY